MANAAPIQPPIVSRWNLFALGTVEGDVRRPKDPVAAWLLKNDPQLMPSEAVGSVLSMIRARTSIIDSMIEAEVIASSRDEEGLDFWSVGGGFDARWYRIKSLMSDAVRRFFEVEIPAVLDHKTHLLSSSSFKAGWREIECRPDTANNWTVRTRGHGNLVCLESVSTRLPPDSLRDLLRRIRSDAPNARVILDIPAFVSLLHSGADLPRDATCAEFEGPEELDNPFRWSHRFFRQLGWDVVEDRWLTSRPQVGAVLPGKTDIPGMEAFRVLRLSATRDDKLKRSGVASISLGPRS